MSGRPTAKDYRNFDIALYRLFIEKIGPNFDEESDDADARLEAALDATMEEFDEPQWAADIFLGVSDPNFEYSDGVIVNFKELES